MLTYCDSETVGKSWPGQMGRSRWLGSGGKKSLSEDSAVVKRAVSSGNRKKASEGVEERV